jgi:hypothetical protein
MQTVTKLTFSAALVVAVCGPGAAAPLAPMPVYAEVALEQVQYRHWHGGPRGPGWQRRHQHGTGAAVIGGLAAGALIGGAIANSQAQANASAYCAQRFRSYDPASGTYIGRDGVQRPCP